MLDGELGVLACTLEDIDFLRPVQQTHTVVHTATNVLLRPIRHKLANLQPALNAEDHLVRVLGVLSEVLVQQVQRVVVRCAVQFATVPEVGAQLEGLVQGFKAHFLRRGLAVPCHSWG